MRLCRFIFALPILILASQALATPPCDAGLVVGDDTLTGDRFGVDIDISNGTAVIGAYLANNPGDNYGAAYVYVWDGLQWVQDAELLGGGVGTQDRFGTAVAIDGDFIAVSATLDDDAGTNAGAVYVYQLVGNVWQEQVKLVPEAASDDDRFGTTLSLHGDVLVVGSPDDDEAGFNAGAAYFYRNIAGVWTLENKAIASDAEDIDKFGRALAVDGDTALVSSYFDDDFGNNAGAVYVLSYNGSTWVEIPGAKLFANNATAGDQFGVSVDLDGDVAIIGAAFQDSSGINAGAAYVFRDKGGSWIQEDILHAASSVAGDQFGLSCSIDGSAIVVGAPEANSTGAAYLFEWDPDLLIWSETTSLAATLNADDDFGGVVEVDGDHILVGADKDDTMGVNAGAAHAFAGLTSSFCQLVDCNGNGIDDADELRDCIDDAACADCNGNGILDECDIANCVDDPACDDCNGNGIPDGCEQDNCVDDPACADCNANGIMDECDILNGDEDDCNDNGIPDSCEELEGDDCNDNDILDICEIDSGDESDCDEDGVLDSCQLDAGTADDCNMNGIIDQCEIDEGDAFDCNDNGQLDSCDIEQGVVSDFNENGIPDICEIDCNDNGIPDFAEIAGNPELDINDNNLLDSCEDCNCNGMPDFMDIADCDGSAWCSDCNENGLPDECDIVPHDPCYVLGDPSEPAVAEDCDESGVPDQCELDDGTLEDLDENGIPDVCDADCNENDIPDFQDIEADPALDCDTNGLIDSCEIEDGTALDCNENMAIDSCDIDNGDSTDLDGNGIPDECDPDCNNNGVPDFFDIDFGISEDLNENGIPDECEADINQDGVVDVQDLLILLNAWGACEDCMDCPGDLVGDAVPADCVVNTVDLLILLSGWTI